MLQTNAHVFVEKGSVRVTNLDSRVAQHLSQEVWVGDGIPQRGYGPWYCPSAFMSEGWFVQVLRGSAGIIQKEASGFFPDAMSVHTKAQSCHILVKGIHIHAGISEEKEVSLLVRLGYRIGGQQGHLPFTLFPFF